MPPITSATIAIRPSSSTSSIRVVSTSSSTGKPRSLSRLRTSAFTTRSRCPVARSMSSACSISRRLTAAPTVPYPRRATGTSTDAMRLLRNLAVLQRPEPLSDLLDLRLGELRAVFVEARLAALHLLDPVLREGAAADVREHGAHVLAHGVVDDLRADRVRAVLGGVGDRVVHLLDAALVDQVDDQLQLVQALVVGDLGLVAGLDERLEPELDQLRDTAAQHRLLAEEVALGLLLERRLEDPGAAGTDRGGVGERELARLA